MEKYKQVAYDALDLVDHLHGKNVSFFVMPKYYYLTEHPRKN